MLNVKPVIPFKFFIEFNGEKVEIEDVVNFDGKTIEFIYPDFNTKLNDIVSELTYSLKESYIYIDTENKEYRYPCYLDVDHILPNNPFLINSPASWIETVRIIFKKGE